MQRTPQQPPHPAATMISTPSMAAPAIPPTRRPTIRGNRSTARSIPSTPRSTAASPVRWRPPIPMWCRASPVPASATSSATCVRR
ncbi:hypothetical protein G6F64_014440 [Rhizopus arrhizus]|uniref:Uncharacterized protein n=1 Tax=Rhizopus oryzae TaxID=64495 RepID=A0A9P6WTH6_RHIOR|nr:hypothetical protein G6F64_014440 [Rhizopus arrhizus]